jgi:hypothetical protein
VVEEAQHAEVRLVQLLERSLVLDRHVALGDAGHRLAHVACDAEPGEAVVQRSPVLVVHARDQLSAAHARAPPLRVEEAEPSLRDRGAQLVVLAGRGERALRRAVVVTEAHDPVAAPQPVTYERAHEPLPVGTHDRTAAPALAPAHDRRHLGQVPVRSVGEWRHGPQPSGLRSRILLLPCPGAGHGPSVLSGSGVHHTCTRTDSGARRSCLRQPTATTLLTGGRLVAALNQLAPASADPKTSPDVAPKYSSSSGPEPRESNACRRTVR